MCACRKHPKVDNLPVVFAKNRMKKIRSSAGAIGDLLQKCGRNFFLRAATYGTLIVLSIEQAQLNFTNKHTTIAKQLTIPKLHTFVCRCGE